MITIQSIIGQARRLGACELIDSVQTLDELIALLFSAQGIEFCENTHYPNDAAMRQIQQEIDLTGYGLYTDCGHAQIQNRYNIAIAGNTVAHIKANRNQQVYRILIFGGSATIHASNYSVIRVINLGGRYNIINDGTAVIL